MNIPTGLKEAMSSWINGYRYQFCLVDWSAYNIYIKLIRNTRV